MSFNCLTYIDDKESNRYAIKGSCIRISLDDMVMHWRDKGYRVWLFIKLASCSSVIKGTYSSLSKQLGINQETLRRWVRTHEKDTYLIIRDRTDGTVTITAKKRDFAGKQLYMARDVTKERAKELYMRYSSGTKAYELIETKELFRGREKFIKEKAKEIMIKYSLCVALRTGKDMSEETNGCATYDGNTSPSIHHVSNAYTRRVSVSRDFIVRFSGLSRETQRRFERSGNSFYEAIQVKGILFKGTEDECRKYISSLPEDKGTTYMIVGSDTRHMSVKYQCTNTYVISEDISKYTSIKFVVFGRNKRGGSIHLPTVDGKPLPPRDKFINKTMDISETRLSIEERTDRSIHGDIQVPELTTREDIQRRLDSDSRYVMKLFMQMKKESTISNMDKSIKHYQRILQRASEQGYVPRRSIQAETRLRELSREKIFMDVKHTMESELARTMNMFMSPLTIKEYRAERISPTTKNGRIRSKELMRERMEQEKRYASYDKDIIEYGLYLIYTELGNVKNRRVDYGRYRKMLLEERDRKENAYIPCDMKQGRLIKDYEQDDYNDDMYEAMCKVKEEDLCEETMS